MVKISVVIPVRISAGERIEKLKKVLSSLLDQTLAKDLYEVIIVDDGSDADIRAELKKFTERKDLKISLLRQNKLGPAAAKNRGIKEAGGEILLFLGDDTIARSNLLQEHLDMHGHYSDCAVNNPILPSEGMDEFSRMIVANYENPEIEEGREYDISAELGFCTACVSLDKKWFRDELFDENFKDAAYEDTELGRRLRDKGLKVILTRKTGVYHEHIHDLVSLSRRARNCGKALVYFKKKDPTVEVPSGGLKYNLKKMIYGTAYIFFKNIPLQKRPKRCAEMIYEYNVMLGIEEARIKD